MGKFVKNFSHVSAHMAITMDRTTNGPLLIGSAEGGADIEDIARRHPEAITKVPIDIASGLTSDMAREFAGRIGFKLNKRRTALNDVNPFAEVHDGSDGVRRESGLR
eukprot:GHVN01012926.1.p2 GENE.GHVN01012926.1~~GHVN01012926.1.p2  ORF type:complete len:107 (+),score=9.91 GHVN01012926.1:183-503(+)